MDGKMSFFNKYFPFYNNYIFSLSIGQNFSYCPSKKEFSYCGPTILFSLSKKKKQFSSQKNRNDNSGLGQKLPL